MSRSAATVRTRAGLSTVLGTVAALLFFLASGALSLSNVEVLRSTSDEIVHSNAVIAALSTLLSAMQDAETGQRGFLLTGNDAYLDPYRAALSRTASDLDAIASLTEDDPAQRASLRRLRPHVEAKLAELKETIDLRRARDLAAALAVVNTDRGKAEMDAIRTQLGLMDGEEARLRAIYLSKARAAHRTAVAGGILTTLLGAALTLLAGALVLATVRGRQREAWLQAGQLGLAEALLGDGTVQQLGDAVLDFLGRFTGAQAGVLFGREGDAFRRTAQSGVPAGAAVPERFAAREGLLGSVAATGRPAVLGDVPDGYLSIGSALGRGRPRHLAIAPLTADGAVNAVIELGFLQPVDPLLRAFLEGIAVPAGVALRSARYRTELQELLEETQRQAEEMQVQAEELRVSNEELEEQGRALRESQVRLEQQQEELEQTNAQLEEQAQLLGIQRDDLARSNAAVELKVRELEQASRYKSDFLANMSHELRTPLNSLLILSRLLADNPRGNLLDEQVRYARTIQSSGNDLLTLINDILDLSKIEAGHVEMRAEPVSPQRLAAGLRQTFEPVAGERRLRFAVDIAEGTPGTIVTDRQRLEQVLRNLLSNAFKFTEAGTVTLRIAPHGPDGIGFAVTDTGIGISAEQHQAIFEAFRQADGAINRRYGGTGLGLSISRELTRLLGGAIGLRSEPGRGSTFEVVLPLAHDPARAEARPGPPAPAAAAAPDASTTSGETPAPVRSPLASVVEDDRDDPEGGRRTLLVVEDDPTFAAVVRDLARQAGFRCLVAGTAAEALDLARRVRPSAVVLDVGLPDGSGLTVLDRLKRDDATRHIPVHVVSGSDQAQTALSLGAVGFLAKPVGPEDLSRVLQTLEARLARTVRRVLVVEDDAVQRDAVEALLGSAAVRTVGAGTAAECLRLLAEETFDCVVLDLSLPDATGFAVLDALGAQGGGQARAQGRAQGDGAFPPVIVYTGRDLSPADEQRLRRHSSAVIVKGAKSPERLLDEVSLFLHQVVSELPAGRQGMIRRARDRDAVLEGRRILVVEDDIRNVYALANILEPSGAVVEIARNGQEALDALAQPPADAARPVELVLMDVMMPVMDGLEAVRRIRLDPRMARLPIIMLTAKAMPDDQERCLAAGASDYMAKPLDVDRLLSLVRVWMPR